MVLADDTRSLTQDCKHVARILNSNLASVFTDEDIKTIPVGQNPLNWITLLESDKICDQEVKNYLHKLDPNKATVPANMLPQLLRELQPLTNIFIRSMQMNKVQETGSGEHQTD